MYAVDVEEERDHEDEQHAVVHDAAHGVGQALERVLDVVDHAAHALVALLAKALLIRAQQRNGEGEPPQGGDDEADARAGEGIQAEHARAGEDEGDACHERDGRANVAPGKTGARHRVHAFIGGDVGEHGVVERHRRVEADGA